MKASKELVRPAVVGVGGGAAAVGDGVADDVEGRGALGLVGLDGGEEVPVVCGLGSGGGLEVGGGNEVARREPAGGAAARVSGDGLAGLAGGEVERDGQDGLRLDWELDGIRDDQGAIGNEEVLFAGEGDGFGAAGLDGAGTGPGSGCGQGDGGGGDGQVGTAEGVAEA